MLTTRKRPLSFRKEVGVAWVDSAGNRQSFFYFEHQTIKSYLFVETHDELSTAWIRFKFVGTLCEDLNSTGDVYHKLRDHRIDLEVFPTNGRNSHIFISLQISDGDVGNKSIVAVPNTAQFALEFPESVQKDSERLCAFSVHLSSNPRIWMRNSSHPIYLSSQEQMDAITKIKSLATTSSFIIFRSFKSSKQRYRFSHGFLRVHQKFQEAISRLGPTATVQMPKFEALSTLIGPEDDGTTNYRLTANPAFVLRGGVKPEPAEEESKKSTVRSIATSSSCQPLLLNISQRSDSRNIKAESPSTAIKEEPVEDNVANSAVSSSSSRLPLLPLRIFDRSASPSIKSESPRRRSTPYLNAIAPLDENDIKTEQDAAGPSASWLKRGKKRQRQGS